MFNHFYTVRDELIEHEGLRLKPYRDTMGKLSIGVGRNLDDDGITKDEALYLLDNDIYRIGLLLCNASFIDFSKIKNEVREGVLIDMAFNLGIEGLSKFKDMLEAIKEDDWDKAADAMLDSLWAKQVGQRAICLAERMRTGKV
jgi:lysozyme